MSEESAIKESDKDSILRQGLSLGGMDKAFFSLVCLYTLVLFIRPQDLPGLAFIGSIRLPAILGVSCGIIWLKYFHKTWNTQTKIIAGIIIFEGLRTLGGYYFDPNDTIVRNDFWQFHSYKALLLVFFGLTFPIAALGSNLQSLTKMSHVLGFIAGALGLYGITHSGTGPGGFLGDENDLCVALLTFIPFIAIVINNPKSSIVKYIYLGFFALALAGIVSTLSRGGMVGLVAMIAYVVIGSRYRLKALVFLCLVLVCAVPFVPSKFWQEFTSIKTDVEGNSGTIRKRREMWKVSMEIFKDPSHTVFGVGMQNATHWIPDYEEKALGRRSKTYAGRSVHSMYYQLLPELGLYGIFCVGIVLIRSFFVNHRLSRELSKYLKKLRSFNPKLEADRARFKQARTEARIAGIMSYGVAASWIGILVAGIGVSILYYPTIWFLVGVSVATERYSRLALRKLEVTAS